MAISLDKANLWPDEIVKSVEYYNMWYLSFAPQAFKDVRLQVIKDVENTFKETKNLTVITPEVLKKNPFILPILRMSTAPPIARDRLIGLAKVSKNLVKCMEGTKDKEPCMPKRMKEEMLIMHLQNISDTIYRLIDKGICPWLEEGREPTEDEIKEASTIIADRVCGAQSDPIIRNAQEQRQLDLIKNWLESKGYKFIESGNGVKFDSMEPGTFAFHVNVPAKKDGKKLNNITVDAVIKPFEANANDLPVMVEAKSAGDFTNPNKRRKEEGMKSRQLIETYPDVYYVLFLCGYFDKNYLEFEARERIDWIWEHNLDDMSKLGV